MDQIIINELALSVRVGVPAAERSKPQRLLVTIEMDHDFSDAAKRDNIGATIDYHAVVMRVKSFCLRKSWKLLEKLSVDLAELVLREFKPKRVTVVIKKFILTETNYVGVRVTRPTVSK